ncbi:MAG: peptidoglycan-binding protein [Clostridia bacterium]|nr:peptidoglycan-binding protein [Clostridia bacterium]
MRKLLIILLALLQCGCAAAEVTCVCGEDACRCFIQQGDEGMAVEFIQNTLIRRGYLGPNSDESAFGPRTLDAVLRFQRDNGLPATGMMDDATLTLLLWGMLPEELDEREPLSNSNAIWIPTDGGIRRHWKNTCSKMHDPRRVSVRNAEMMNMQPCGRCNKDGLKELTGDAPRGAASKHRHRRCFADLQKSLQAKAAKLQIREFTLLEATPREERRLYHMPLTMLSGRRPASASRICRLQASAISRRVWAVLVPVWGVQTTLSKVSSSGGMWGSSGYTSSPAPRKRPLRSASTSAGVSTTAPRAVLMRIAPGFICQKAAAFIRPRVSAVRGQWRLTTSASRSRCGRSTGSQTEASAPLRL